MAQKRNDDLFRALRGYGVRRRVAEEVARVGGARGRGSEGEKLARQTIDDLTSASEAIRKSVLRKDRARSAAGQKAARTRKRKAVKRSASARKAAHTRTRASRARKRTT